jgi:hypothetical protein
MRANKTHQTVAAYFEKSESAMSIARILQHVAPIAMLLASALPTVKAADGDPIAIRQWPDGVFRVETHWGLELGVLPSEATDRPADATDRHDVALGTKIDHVLARRPNQDAVSWEPAGESEEVDSIHVSSVLGGEHDSDALLVRVDGVGILFVSESMSDPSADRNLTLANSIDVIVLSAGQRLPLTNQFARWIKLTKPRFVLLNADAPDGAAEKLCDLIGASKDVRRPSHNTFAIAKASDHDRSTRVVRLNSVPWQMPEELEKLFSAMEASCRESQAVFEKLSVEQLNFRPSNGTHTPRWNSEHMMGRQLLFFSQIYHAVDPMIPVMDLNPKQMPPDYVAAHPDWDGKEEARQTNRVSEFSRRFAYLLEDIDLDDKAPDSRWTLRGLLRQMERHYEEHTSNTTKKFELVDWPTR